MSKRLPNDVGPRRRFRMFLLGAFFVAVVGYIGLWLVTAFWGIPQVRAEYDRQILSMGGRHSKDSDQDSAVAPFPFYVVIETRYRYYYDPPVASGEYWWFFGEVRTINVKPLPKVRGF